MLRSKTFLFTAFSLLFGSLCYAEQQPCTEIDVLIVFDKNAARKVRSNMQEWGQRAVNNLQQAMVRSELGDQIHFNLVGIRTLDGYEAATWKLQQVMRQVDPHVPESKLADMGLQFNGTETDWKNIITGKIPGLQEERNQKHADLVLLAQYYDLPALGGMGFGYYLKKEFVWDADGQADKLYEPLFSEKNFVACLYYDYLVNPDNGSDVFVHEVLHVFGCGHSDRQNMGEGPFYYPDSSGFATDDFRYCTIMTYPEKRYHKPHSSVPHVDGDSYTLTCLSGDYSPRLTGRDAHQPGLPERVGDKMHNNRMVALRNAALVSSYRMSGNEKVINADPVRAIPLPPMLDSETWVRNSGQRNSDRMSLATAVLEKSIPGLTRENVLTTLVFGTNKPAPVSESGRISGGSGKSVWYKLTPPATGTLRVGIRRVGTEADFSPVIAVRRADNAACNTTPLPEADSAGYLRVVELQAEADKELLIQVDSGNANGGQFSLVAQLDPSAETTTHPGGGGGTSGTSGDTANGNSWTAVDTLLLLIALFSSTSTVILFIKILKGKPRDPQREPWTPTKGEAPQKQAPKQAPQVSGRQLVLRGTLYNGTHREYTYPLAQLVSEGNITLGYDDSCSIRITDDTISGNHAIIALSPHHSGLTIMDVGSTNGTLVEGRRITPGERVTLCENDNIQLGLAKFTISIR